MANSKLLMPFILKWEGGFVNDPDDLGGATNKGVTLTTFRQYFGKERTVNDLKNITDDQWLHIFKSGFWDTWKADQINSQSVANILVDWVWASGGYGVKRPQKVLGVKIDGVVGPVTIQAVNSWDPKELFEAIKRDRIDYIEAICVSRPTNRKYIKGWLNRINDLKFEG